MKRNVLIDNIRVNCDYFEHVKGVEFTPTDIDISVHDGFLKEVIYNNFPIITHSGQFHADEVFSIALIMLARMSMVNSFSEEHVQFKPAMLPNLEITRRGEPLLNDEEGKMLYQNNLILDIKNGHFDHHDPNHPQYCGINPFKRADDTSSHASDIHNMATFGRLWKPIGPLFNIELNDPKIVSFNVYDKVYWDLIDPIDRCDVYGPSAAYSPYSLLISSMNGCSEMEIDFMKSFIEDDNVAFYEAIMMAYKILRLHVLKAQRFMESFNKLSTDEIEIKDNGNGVKYLYVKPVETGKKEPFIPLDAVQYICDGAIKMLVNANPAERDGAFRCVAVNSSKSPFDPAIKGMNGVKFYHPQNFMVTFNSFEDQEAFTRSAVMKGSTISIAE